MNWNLILGGIFVMLVVGSIELHAQLRIELNEIRQEKGSVRIALFDTPEGYLMHPVDSLSVAADADQLFMEFANLAPGRYAFALFHDLNDNGKLDRNWLGIPSEPFAFSNNAMGRFSEPNWEQACFELKEGRETHRICLKHFSL